MWIVSFSWILSNEGIGLTKILVLKEISDWSASKWQKKMHGWKWNEPFHIKSTEIWIHYFRICFKYIHRVIYVIKSTSVFSFWPSMLFFNCGPINSRKKLGFSKLINFQFKDGGTGRFPKKTTFFRAYSSINIFPKTKNSFF